MKEGISNRLIRCIFEMKAMVVNGEFPGVPGDGKLSESAAYTLEFIALTAPEKLYTFMVTESVLLELQEVAAKYREKIWEHHFKSLEMLESL